MKVKLELNEIQACMLARVLKEEIVQQRMWRQEEINEYGNRETIKDHRDSLSANMWELIEQLCSQGVEEYWLPHCMNRTDEEEYWLNVVQKAK